MTIELTLLGWTLLLALVYILLPATLRNKETGNAYNVSARDSAGPTMGVMTARLKRAQANLFETLPLLIGAVLVAHVAGREGALTVWGAAIYLAARVAYLPLYAFGVPVLRTLTWLVSMLGLGLILWAILSPA